MTRYRILYWLAVVCICAPPARAQKTWQRVSTFRFDWDGHTNVVVALEIPSPWSSPGDFTRIHIRVPGQKEFTFTNKTGWVKYGADAVSISPEIRAKRNLIQSNYLLALQVSDHRVLLFLTGYAYASSPGALDVLEISDAGRPSVILHKAEFGLKDVRDLNMDGLAEIIGYPCLSEEFGNGLMTYDPFNVYTVAPERGKLTTLSIPLSKTYNLEHYYGWAGPACSEKTAVVLRPPRGGKPMVTSLANAEKITGFQ